MDQMQTTEIKWNTVQIGLRAVVKLNSKVGVSHSVSRENPNSNAVRGSSSSSARNQLSSFSFYLLLTILINIIFIQCNFWFKLFEWRRYAIDAIDLLMAQPDSMQPNVNEMNDVSVPSVIFDQFSTMGNFWFRIQHLFPWFLLISFNKFAHFVQLFIQSIYLNCTFVAYAMLMASSAKSIAVNTIDAITANPIRLNANFYITNDANHNHVNGIIDHDMHFDHKLFCSDAINHQTIIQNKPTDHL